MLETTRRRDRRDGRERRDRRAIEDVASELFRANGYAATSVRDIARALDLQGASLYAHVASKEDVLWSIVDRTATRFERAAEDAVGVAEATRPGDPIARLEALVRAHVAVLTHDIEAAAVFVSEWRSLGEPRRAAILARRDAYEARFRAAVADGIASGALPLADPAVTATVLLTALNGLVAWYRPNGRLAADRLADHLAAFALRAAGAEPS